MKKNIKCKFLSNVYQEFKRINWVSYKDLVSLLIVVLAAVLLSVVFTLGVDYVIHNLVKFLINL